MFLTLLPFGIVVYRSSGVSSLRFRSPGREVSYHRYQFASYRISRYKGVEDYFIIRLCALRTVHHARLLGGLREFRVYISPEEICAVHLVDRGFLQSCHNTFLNYRSFGDTRLTVRGTVAG
jgi:hypothetical protein